jgi:hAT family C-terminal dimerisation region
MPLYEKNTSQELSDFDRIAQDLDKVTRPASQDEFEDYNTESPYKIRTSALTWWCQDEQQKCWPRLSYMAVDILSIPAMSDEPERIFSGAHCTISWERAQLSAENIERTECLKHWQKSGISEEKLEK